jgi:Fe2+ transport system protein B
MTTLMKPLITTAEENDNFSVSDSVMSKTTKTKKIHAHDVPKFWSVPVAKLLATAEKELDEVNKKLATYNELKKRQQGIEVNVRMLRTFMKEAKPKPMSSIPERHSKKRKVDVQSVASDDDDEENLDTSDEENNKGSQEDDDE